MQNVTPSLNYRIRCKTREFCIQSDERRIQNVMFDVRQQCLKIVFRHVTHFCHKFWMYKFSQFCFENIDGNQLFKKTTWTKVSTIAFSQCWELLL